MPLTDLSLAAEALKVLHSLRFRPACGPGEILHARVQPGQQHLPVDPEPFRLLSGAESPDGQQSAQRRRRAEAGGKRHHQRGDMRSEQPEPQRHQTEDHGQRRPHYTKYLFPLGAVRRGEEPLRMRGLGRHGRLRLLTAAPGPVRVQRGQGRVTDDPSDRRAQSGKVLRAHGFIHRVGCLLRGPLHLILYHVVSPCVADRFPVSCCTKRSTYISILYHIRAGNSLATLPNCGGPLRLSSELPPFFKNSVRHAKNMVHSP